MSEEAREAFKWPEVMVDLETLALSPAAVVLSVGLCAFDPAIGAVGPSLHVRLDPRAQKNRRIDAGTVLWWMSQGDEARGALVVLDGKGNPLDAMLVGHALARVNDFFGENMRERCGVWGNGSDFDNAVLADLYRWNTAKGGSFVPEQPWAFHQNRCFRTLKNVFRADYEAAVAGVPRDGHHNAEADARWQAKVAARILCTVVPLEEAA
jgi:hypothetical protein